MFDTSATAHDLNVDNGTFVVDGSASRVGIGTATPSTLLDVNGTATATTFVGALTGNVTGNVSGTAATVTGAAQANITSVGTLSSLTVSGALNATLSTAAQPNITSTGTLNALSIAGNLTVDTNTLHVDASNNQVGIGLTSGMSSILTVNSEISLGPDANNRGIINYSSNTLSLGTRQSSSNYFSTVNVTSGKVGIGTSAPNAILEANGAVTFSNIDTFGQFVIKSASGTTGQMMNFGVSTAGSGYSFIQSLNRGTAHDSLVFQPYGGNVLIGTSTETAAYSSFVSGQSNKIFEISTAAAANQGGSVIVLTNQTANASNLSLGSLTFTTSGTSSAEKRGGIIGVQTTADSSSNVSALMNFWTNNAGTISKKLEITPAGQVLIGDGSVSAPSLGFLNDTDTGIIRVTTNALGIAAGGSRKFYVNATNAYFQNLTQVQIDSGNFYVNGHTGFRTTPDSNYAFVALQNSSLTHGGYMSIQGGSATGLEINANATTFAGTVLLAKQSQATSGGYLARFANSAGDKVVINTSGSVVATAGISSYSNSGANVAYDVPWQNSAVALEMKYDGTYYMNIETHAQTRDLIFNNLTNDGTGDIRFNTGTGSLTERLAIKADGKISLGTASYIEKDYRNLYNATATTVQYMKLYDKAGSVPPKYLHFMMYAQNYSEYSVEVKIHVGTYSGFHSSYGTSDNGQGVHCEISCAGLPTQTNVFKEIIEVANLADTSNYSEIWLKIQPPHSSTTIQIREFADSDLLIQTTNNSGWTTSAPGNQQQVFPIASGQSSINEFIFDRDGSTSSHQGDYRIVTSNARQKYLQVNAVAEISESFNLAGNTTYNFDYTVPNEGGHGNSFFIIAGFEHFHNGAYGAHRVCFASARGTSLTVHSSIVNQTSTNGGQWNISKASATTLRIQKAAGTYTGSGSGFIKVFFRNAIG